MTEFAMGPSVAPALHLVALRQVSKDAPLNGIQDERSSGYHVAEESITCLTNLADSGGCQWGPVGGLQWIKQGGKSLGRSAARKSNGLEELFAQQSEVGFLSDRKSDSTDEFKRDGADNLTSISCEEVRKLSHKEALTNVDGVLYKADSAREHEHGMEKRTYQSVDRGREDGYGHHSPECNISQLKPQTEKLGWRNVGRHAENRRKRWAQSDPLLDIWKAVSSSRHAAPFRRPVALLDDYDSIIRQPIDLSTIRRQLESDESYNLESLRRDLMLMVTNALVYNKRGTETYEMAVKLKAHACRLFEGQGKDTILFGYKASCLGNPGKSAVKISKAKAALKSAAELQNESESLPLAPVKKHRTMRRPRTCISNDAGGLRSDVANGAAMDSSSEEEAAAVLICFSSGQPGDDKYPLSKSKVAKLESPRKRLRRVETGTDESSDVLRGGASVTEQRLVGVDRSIMSAGPSPATLLRGVEIRPKLEEPEKYRYWAAIDISQTKEFEKLGVSVSVINERPVGTSSAPSSRDDDLENRRSERTCMGLKHKWQERWRMQSAACSESSGSLQQTTEQVGVKPFGDKYPMEGGSGGDTNYRPFPQEHAQVLRSLV